MVDQSNFCWQFYSDLLQDVVVADLDKEIAGLEGLMRDLNEITAGDYLVWHGTSKLLYYTILTIQVFLEKEYSKPLGGGIFNNVKLW